MKKKYFRFGLRGTRTEPLALLERHPMAARNCDVELAQIMAANVILSNATDGEVVIRNFGRISADKYGFGRSIFSQALKHLDGLGIIKWEANGTNQTTITYQQSSTPITQNIKYTPRHGIALNLKGNREAKMKINTKAKKVLDKRIKSYWAFAKQHDLQHNINQEQFDIAAEYNMALREKKQKPAFPNLHNVCPVAVFNDRSISIGGRFYRAFWIGMPRQLRRLITIDGEKTCDIDGRSMHVQLLYKKAGVPAPDCELYIYPKSDPRRKICKRLMLFMMNTRKDHKGSSGRIAVIKTYKKHHTVNEDLMKYIHQLEELHQPIKHLLYKSNWGELQGTEASIMLNIMEQAMNENILVLPVHDGCLCKLHHRDRVLELFQDQGIEAEENEEHLQPINWEKIRGLYDLKQKEKLLAEKREKILEEMT